MRPRLQVWIDGYPIPTCNSSICSPETPPQRLKKHKSIYLYFRRQTIESSLLFIANKATGKLFIVHQETAAELFLNGISSVVRLCDCWCIHIHILILALIIISLRHVEA